MYISLNSRLLSNSSKCLEIFFFNVILETGYTQLETSHFCVTLFFGIGQQCHVQIDFAEK